MGISFPTPSHTYHAVTNRDAYALSPLRRHVCLKGVNALAYLAAACKDAYALSHYAVAYKGANALV